MNGRRQPLHYIGTLHRRRGGPTHIKANRPQHTHIIYFRCKYLTIKQNMGLANTLKDCSLNAYFCKLNPLIPAHTWPSTNGTCACAIHRRVAPSNLEPILIIVLLHNACWGEIS